MRVRAKRVILLTCECNEQEMDLIANGLLTVVKDCNHAETEDVARGMLEDLEQGRKEAFKLQQTDRSDKKKHL